ncbi:transcriptional regulator [Klebsiella michiganensis]|uniref:Transcriptional regulator n=1 Tax=Klebsiella michiganensis TaxID=1134687 RepID=A0A7H4N084_9ENTR|nr:transcriptional regulator [Klebsiella michiganensis]
MAKRENYNDLYLFMLVVREGSFTARGAAAWAGAIRRQPCGT